MPVRNGKPNHKSPIPSIPTARTLQTNSSPFRDHHNTTAHMVFESYTNYPLPPLFVFLIYFTHPDASPNYINQKELLQALNNNNRTNFRLELFFLPGATDEDCVDHYRGEKAARGDYHVQVAAVEENDPDQDFDESYERLPGLVPTYTHSAGMNNHYSLLFICPPKNWTDGGGIIHLVKFAPISEEEYEQWRDPGEPARLPEKRVIVLPVNEKSLLYRVGGKSVRGADGG